MATNISSNNALNSYALFNATDIKSYIINQLSNSDNPVFSGCSYLGSNMNAFIDVLAVMTQQILFHLSVNTSEANFATANLYESMSKLVSILNYKVVGKQTSMLPVRFSIDVGLYKQNHTDATQITIPRLTHVAYNGTYYLKNEIVIPISDVSTNSNTLTVDTIMFEGELQQNTNFVANGDEFETFILEDNYIKTGNRFISDNFFLVYVNENGDGVTWKEYTETSSLFLHGVDETRFERKFNEDLNYEFKFGNGINCKKLPRGARVAIFYIISNGETGILGDDTITATIPFEYESSLWSSIINSNYTTIDKNNDIISSGDYVYATNTGNGTDISYPESVASIRANAPRLFASQNRLFTLNDYYTFIKKNFGTYIKDLYLCKNDEYTRDYLRYFYDIGLDAPQDDSRLNIAQVEFMTSTNFNNIYCFTVPSVNTLIGGRVPNYLNTTLKQQIVNATDDYRGVTHNLVLLDPIYKAITWGSYMDSTDFNANQLSNRLVLVRNRLTKYSYSYIKQMATNVIKDFFSKLTIGSQVNLAQLTKDLNGIPGVKRFYIKAPDGSTEKKLTLYTWNPLYSNEDNQVTQQTIINERFVYPYFYDLDNVGERIDIEEE